MAGVVGFDERETWVGDNVEFSEDNLALQIQVCKVIDQYVLDDSFLW